jgi:ATP-binding protein involved in chromosome partitioning
MAALTLPDGSSLALFGVGGGAAVADALSGQEETVPLLGSVPLSPALREGGDTGIPIVVSDPEDPAAQALSAIAAGLARRPRGLRGRTLPVSPA